MKKISREIWVWLLLKILRKMEHLLQKSKCSIFHYIFKYMIFQRRQKALLWSKGLFIIVYDQWKKSFFLLYNTFGAAS